MRLMILWTSGLLFAGAVAALATPPTPPGTSVGHVEMRVKPTWVWVASVKSTEATNATLALAKANIPAVFEGSPLLQLYVHPADLTTATSALRKDGSAKHYQVNFGLKTAKPKSKKPSH